jgi:hypothetical protein
LSDDAWDAVFDRMTDYELDAVFARILREAAGVRPRWQ